MRPDAEDYYSVLGVTPAASDEALKAAFRRQVKVLHPDKNPQSTNSAAFQRVQEAYAVLGDPMQRKLYDLGQAMAEGPPSDYTAHARVASVSKRRRGWVVAVLATAAAVIGFFFYLLQPGRYFFSAGPSQSRPDGGSTLSSLDQAMQAAVLENARNFSGPRPSPTSEVEIAGRNGRRYVLSGAIARQYELARDVLISAFTELESRAGDLKERSETLERERGTLGPSDVASARLFNEKVDRLNRDRADFREAVEKHDKKADAFFLELDHVSLRVIEPVPANGTGATTNPPPHS